MNSPPPESSETQQSTSYSAFLLKKIGAKQSVTLNTELILSCVHYPLCLRTMTWKRKESSGKGWNVTELNWTCPKIVDLLHLTCQDDVELMKYLALLVKLLSEKFETLYSRILWEPIVIWGMLQVSNVFITTKQYLLTFLMPNHPILMMEIISCPTQEGNITKSYVYWSWILKYFVFKIQLSARTTFDKLHRIFFFLM